MTSLPLNNFTNLRLLTALISLMLSSFAFYTDDIINSDGVLYMDMAEAYLQGGLAEMSKLYNWPFFAIIVAYFHKLTLIPFEISANILNTLLFVVLTDTLLLISNKILPPRTQQIIFAAILILCFHSLNDYRDFIIRDVGYWAFCSLALYNLMIYVEKPSLKSATLWQLMAVTAILFRIEGVAILFGLPLYLFVHKPIKTAFKQYLTINYLLIIGFIIVSFFTISLMGGLNPAFGKLSYVLYFISTDNLLASFNAKSAIMGTDVLNSFSAKYSGLILSSGLIVMLFYKLIKSVSIGYIILFFISRYQDKTSILFPHKNLLLYFVLLNIFILVTFIFQRYFMSTRYSVMTLIGILLFFLPRICQGIESAWKNRQKMVLIIAGLVLTISLIDSLTQSNSKSFIKDTAIWAANNLPQESHILTDEKLLRYYFSINNTQAEIDVKSSIDSYRDYNYLLLVEKKRNKQLKNMPLELIYSQKNKRGDQASIYKVSP